MISQEEFFKFLEDEQKSVLILCGHCGQPHSTVELVKNCAMVEQVRKEMAKR